MVSWKVRVCCDWLESLNMKLALHVIRNTMNHDDHEMHFQIFIRNLGLVNKVTVVSVL